MTQFAENGAATKAATELLAEYPTLRDNLRRHL